jgi:pimeloyl-ACP methyl ester carboxylesterase
MKKLLIAVSMFCSLVANAQEGRWKGELDLPGMKLPIVFNFSSEGCTMDSPSQGAVGIKTDWTRSENGDVKISIPTIGGSYEGRLEGKEIKGVFKQMGMSFPLNLTEARLNRPQTPVAPFPYTTEEAKFKNGDIELNGTLTLPAGFSKKTPVLVMVTGSGQQNRDEELFEHKPFAVIADAFARKGIATLRYDDRFFGDKSKDFGKFTTYDFKEDALAAINLLRGRFDNVGVLGHSDGGTIALMLAAEGKVDFAVSMAGVGGSGKENLLLQNKAIFKSSGYSDDVVNAYCEVLDKVFGQMAEGKRPQGITIPESLPIALKSNLQTIMSQPLVPYLSTLLSIDMSKSLSKIKCPVLAINGKLDLQVDHTYNLGVLEKGLTNCKHKIVTFEGLNHLFQHCKTGSPNEYSEIEETISPEVLDVMTDWIRQQ